MPPNAPETPEAIDTFAEKVDALQDEINLLNEIIKSQCHKLAELQKAREVAYEAAERNVDAILADDDRQQREQKKQRHLF